MVIDNHGIDTRLAVGLAIIVIHRIRTEVHLNSAIGCGQHLQVHDLKAVATLSGMQESAAGEGIVAR